MTIWTNPEFQLDNFLPYINYNMKNVFILVVNFIITAITQIPNLKNIVLKGKIVNSSRVLEKNQILSLYKIF